MSNPHLQTVLSSVGRKLWPSSVHQSFHAASKRELLSVRDVTLTVDLNLNESGPLIIIIPGWLGHSQSTYVLASGHALYAAGYSVARLNLRDHGDTAHMNRGLFNSALIEEVIASVDQLNIQFGDGRTGLVGFSLGGNFALRLARALPDLTTLAVCPAINPADTMYNIDRNPIYQRYFIKKWRQVWLAKKRAFPDHFDFGESLSLTTVSALTDYFVKYHSNFETTDAYFAAYDLSGSALAGVSAQILASADDPIIPISQYQNLPSNVHLDVTQVGGHHAYLDSWRLTSWVDQYLLNYFSTLREAT